MLLNNIIYGAELRDRYEPSLSDSLWQRRHRVTARRVSLKPFAE